MRDAREIDPSIRRFQSALQALGVARAVSIVRNQQNERITTSHQSAEISNNPDIIDIRHRHPDFLPDLDITTGSLPSSTSSRTELRGYLDSIRPNKQSHVTLMTDTYINTNTANQQDIS